MAVQFTPQQNEAIQALGTNVLVSASAGAGKTAVLIGRLMKRITVDRVSLNDIVAMTFTEAAAAEMKTRLLGALTQALEAHPDDPFLQEQCQLVEVAHISTIHSFCLRIIKDHGYILGIDPVRTTNIMDTPTVKQYQEAAFDTVFKQWIVSHESVLSELLDHFSLNPLSTRGFKDAIFKIISWMNTKEDVSDAFNHMMAINQATTFDDLPSDYQTQFFKIYHSLLESIYDTLVAMRHACTVAIEDEKDAAKALKAFEALSTLLATLEVTLELVAQKDISFYDTLPSVLDIKTPALGFLAEYSNLRKDILDPQINVMMSFYQPLHDALSTAQASASTLEALYQFAGDVQREYQSIKEIHQCFDFDDFESYALKLLRVNDGAISKQFQSHLQEIMVDEFQDTNDFQDAIIRAISNGHNIFRVGDVKQSIYGFRGAKPAIMQALQADDEVLNLNISSNFRSKATIVETNNVLFKQLMDLTLHSKYQPHDIVSPGTDQQHVDTNPVELHLIESIDGMSRNQLKARHIANDIIRLHQEEGVAFKDIMILIRNHNDKAFLKKAFEEANIPHYLPLKEGFYQSEIIQAIISCISYAMHRDEYVLATLLLSPLFNFSKDDVALMHLEYGSVKDGFKEGYAQAYEALQSLFASWKQRDVYAIIQSIFAFNNTYHSLDLQSQTNADHLLDLVSQREFTSLSDFMSYIHIVVDDTSSEEASFKKEDDDVVTTMTIHQSKGLQFPVVYVWGLPKHSVRDHHSALITDDAFGFNINAINTETDTSFENIHRFILEEKQHHEALEETLRILYVALTRAQQRMMIVEIGDDASQELSAPLLRFHKRNTDLIAAARIMPHLMVKRVIDASAFTLNTLDYDVSDKDMPYPLKDASYTKPTFIPNEGSSLNLDMAQGTAYGTQVHEALETLERRLWTEDDVSVYGSQIASQLLTFNTHPFTSELYELPVHVVEFPFIIDGELGIMDWIAMNDTELFMIDYKTDNASTDEILMRYHKQMAAYANALNTLYPDHTVHQYIYSFKHHTYLTLT